MPYYTLLKFDTGLKKWIPEFGDYDHQNVIDEMDDCKDMDLYSEAYKIIKTADQQSDIESFITALNGG